MSAVEGLGVALVVLIVLGATWMTYVALGHMLNDFRTQWRKLAAQRKRVIAISMAVTAALCVAGVAVVVVQPWGARTFLYGFGSVAALAVIGGLIGAAGTAFREIRQARARSDLKH